MATHTYFINKTPTNRRAFRDLCRKVIRNNARSDKPCAVVMLVMCNLRVLFHRYPGGI